MKRDVEILLLIIQAVTHLGSIIITDNWNACNIIEKLENGYDHKNINRSKHFVDLEAGAYANRIERRWCKLKQKIPKRRYSFDKVGYDILVQVWHHKKTIIFGMLLQKH